VERKDSDDWVSAFRRFEVNGINTDATFTIASTMVGARLDYCNAILKGTTKSIV